VASLLRKGNYTPRKRLKDTIDVETLSQLKKEGKTNKEIADILGIKLLTLKDWKLSQYESPLSDKYGAKYIKQLDFFSDISTEEQAYVLGFVAADGSINHRGALRIELSSKDKAHLERISSLLCGDYTVTETHRNRIYKGKEVVRHSCVFNITCARWRDDLIKLGIVPNKTYKSFTMPTIIPQPLKRDFIRGYFDGNGSVGSTKAKIDICGGHTLLESILTCLQQEGIGVDRVVKKKTTQKDSYFYLCSQQDIQNLYYYLYDGATLYLDRKKVAWECHLTP
jgi:hypothetical protein